MAARIFACLAALFLVVAVGIAALTPLGVTLGYGLTQLDRGALVWLEGHSLPWAWTSILTPILLRPMWLVPASIGLVFAGLALTLNLGKPSPSRRRRS